MTERTNVTNHRIRVGCLLCLVPVPMITIGNARCDWFKCNSINLIKVQRERLMKPLCARGFYRGFSARAVEAKQRISVRPRGRKNLWYPGLCQAQVLRKTLQRSQWINIFR